MTQEYQAVLQDAVDWMSRYHEELKRREAAQKEAAGLRVDVASQSHTISKLRQALVLVASA